MAFELVRLFPPISKLIELDQRLPEQFACRTDFGGGAERQNRCEPFAPMLQLCQRSFHHFAPLLQGKRQNRALF
jgi:hypothetical protein